MENSIINKIVAVTNHSRIYIDSDREAFKENYQKLSEFLKKSDKKHDLFIEGKGLLSYDNENFKVARVIGLKNIQKINFIQKLMLI